MTTKILTTIAILTVLYSNKCFAQFKNLPLFLKVDFGSSNIKRETGKSISALAFGIGIETFYKLKSLKKEKDILINPSFSYLKTGYDLTGGGTTRVNYLSFGLPFCYEISGVKTGNDIGVIVGLGPFLNVGLNGEFKNTGTSNIRAISFGNTATDNRKRTDAGIILKAAVRKNKLYMGLQYNIGTANEIPNARISNGSYIHTRNFLFYSSYNIRK